MIGKLLQPAELFWISIVRGDGRPHVTPQTRIEHHLVKEFSDL